MCGSGVEDTWFLYPWRFIFHFNYCLNCRGDISSERDPGCGGRLVSFRNSVLGVGVRASGQNSHELGPHRMYGLMGKTDQNCGEGKDAKLQDAVIK